MKLHHILEALPGVDPEKAETVIRQSFDDRVISDLLADETNRGDQNAQEIIDEITSKFPSIAKTVKFRVNPKANRVRIYFDSAGKGTHIDVPTKMKPGLGIVQVLHEIAHMLYTKDLLTNNIVQHGAAPQLFTVMRVLEDIAIEKRLEEEHPNAIDIFKGRAQHIIPLYKQNKPSPFAKQIDELFLHLRGYKKDFSGDPEILQLAQTYLNSDDLETKVDAVVSIGEKLLG